MSGKLGRFGIGLIGTAARSDGSDPNDDKVMDLGSFNRTTTQLTGTYDLGEGSLLRVDGLRYRESQRGPKGGYFGKGYPFTPSSFLKEDIDILRDEVSLGWDRHFADSSLLTVRGRYSRRDQDTSGNFPGGHRPYMFVDEFSRAAEIRYQRNIWDRHIPTVGVTGRFTDVNGKNIKRTVLFPRGQKVVEQIDQ